MANVMYIQLFPEKLKEITSSTRKPEAQEACAEKHNHAILNHKQPQTPCIKWGYFPTGKGVLPYRERYPTLQGNTYTKITTKTTTHISLTDSEDHIHTTPTQDQTNPQRERQGFNKRKIKDQNIQHEQNQQQTVDPVVHTFASNTNVHDPKNAYDAHATHAVHPDCQEMIRIWNKHTQSTISEEPDKRRSFTLLHALKKHFKNNLEDWDAYCAYIAQSDFLMRRNSPSNFKAAIDWVIIPNNIQKIREGNYHQDQKEISSSATLLAQKKAHSSVPENLGEMMKDHIAQEKDPTWKTVQTGLLRTFGPAIFKSWLMKLKLCSVEGNKAVVSLPTRFFEDYVSVHYRHYVQRFLSECTGQEIFVELIVVPEDNHVAHAA